jgi:hypothetical protein
MARCRYAADTRPLKPIITVYSTGTTEPTKKFEGYITAAFWIGVDHSEGEVASVKVRQATESYDTEVELLNEFTGLMVRQQINFSVEFFAEPAETPVAEAAREPEAEERAVPVISTEGAEIDFEAELTKVKNQYKKGLVTKKQFEAKKEELLKGWRERIEGSLGK